MNIVKKILIFLVKKVHREIAKAIGKTESSTVRILEELTNHYFLSKDYSLLKQTIATIDTFLLLFNPYTKYDLCRYWQVLEGKGYDPVVEYNNGLELFDMHYSPKPEDLFTIILQISRFLKEFSDFETNKNTPKFRHPYIRGKTVMKRFDSDDDLIDGLDDNLKITDSRVIEKKSSNKEKKKELKENQDKEKDQDPENYNLLLFLKVNSKEAKTYIEERIENKTSVHDFPFKEDIDTIYAEIPNISTETSFNKHKLSYLDDIGLAEEIKAMKMMKEDLESDFDIKDTENVENLNFDVSSGKVKKILLNFLQVKFLEHFREVLKRINHRDKLVTDEDHLRPLFIMEEYEDEDKALE